MSLPTGPVWVLPRLITSAIVERALSFERISAALVEGTKLRSGPAADGRLLALLELQRLRQHNFELRLQYVLAGAQESSQGWLEVLERPSVHLLAQYAAAIVDADGNDVAASVLTAQQRQRGSSGRVTSTGGQTAILDQSSMLASGESRTMFALKSPLEIQSAIEDFALKRGSVSIRADIVTYIAEAIENVRDHSLLGPDGESSGMCLFVLRRTNPNQLPALLRMLPASSPLRAYLERARIEFGSRLSSFIELTIADSGPGIAFTLSGESKLDETAEHNWLLKAFEDGVSRKSSPGRGGGLTAMLQAVAAAQGAIQVRSGRWSIYREFDNLKGHDDEWRAVSSPYAVGTAITVLFPTAT
jgi:hypothetical protein